jgi:hypothetical protein
MTIEQQLEIAHYGAMFLSEPCSLCGRITYAGARIQGRFIYLCRVHCSRVGLEEVLRKEKKI